MGQELPSGNLTVRYWKWPSLNSWFTELKNGGFSIAFCMFTRGYLANKILIFAASNGFLRHHKTSSITRTPDWNHQANDYLKYIYIWLVVYLPLWKIWVRQLGWLFPIYGKIKNVPNQQPDIYIYVGILSLYSILGTRWAIDYNPSTTQSSTRRLSTPVYISQLVPSIDVWCIDRSIRWSKYTEVNLD